MVEFISSWFEVCLQTAWIQILALLLMKNVILGKFCNFAVPWFPLIKSRDNNSA